MRRLVTAIVLMLAGASGAVAAGLEGRWSQQGTEFAGCGAGAEGGLEVDRDGLVLGETACGFGATAPAGFAGVGGRMTCLVEGTQAMEADVRLRLEGGEARLSFDGATPMRFRRC